MSPTVFVADDNAAILEGLEHALVSHGYVVRTAVDGREMMNLLSQATVDPDLLLLDVMMPGMGGVDVLRSVRAEARWADLPVLLITAGSEDSLPPSVTGDGAVEVLVKPFRLAELLARLGARLEHPGTSTRPAPSGSALLD